MNITKIASGSNGNCIVVDDGQTQVMLDAGVPYGVIRKSGVRLSHVSACLITHEHQDHCAGALQVASRGVVLYSSEATLKHINAPYAFSRAVKPMKKFVIGSWMCMAFPVEHDAMDPLGFILYSMETKDKVCYIVDSAVVNYSFSGVTHWLIEANYSHKEIMESDHIEDSVKRRIIKTHMSFENLEKYLSDSDLSATKQIHILHISEHNADPYKFVRNLEEMAGCPVYI